MAEVNNGVVRGYTDPDKEYAIEEDSIFEVNYGGFLGRTRKDYRDNETYKWCKNV